MPIVTQQEDEAGLGAQSISAGIDAEKAAERASGRLAEQLPSFRDVFGATAIKENDVVAPLLSQSFGLDNTPSEGFSVYDSLTEDEKNSPISHEYLRANNPAFLEAIRTDISNQRYADEVISKGTWSARNLSSLGTLFASPITLVPFGAVVKGGKAIGVAEEAIQVAAGAGKAQIGKTAAVTGGIGLASAGASEALLHASDPTRTREQTMFALGGATVLSGLLGASAAKLSRKEFNALAAKLEQGVNEAPNVSPSPELKQFMDSVGAARRQRLGLDDLTISGAAAQRVSYATRFLSPHARLSNSPFTSTRDTFYKLAENVLTLNANKRGISTGAASETLHKLFDPYRVATLEAISTGLKKLKKNESARVGEGGQKLTEEQYRERVVTAMRNNDIDPEYPEITEAARKIRKDAIDPVTRWGKDVGLLSEDVKSKFAPSYLLRIWDKPKLVADPKGAHEILREAAVNLVSGRKQDISQLITGTERMYEKRISDNIARIARAKAELARDKVSTKIDLSQVSEFEDTLKDFMQKAGKEATVEKYLADNNLQDVAHAVTLVRMKTPKKPKGLYQFAKENGGLIDDGGELANAGIPSARSVKKADGQTSLVVGDVPASTKKRPMELDELAERAHEAGYYAERPTVAELLNDLADDFNDVAGKYSINDSDILDNYVTTMRAKDEAEALLSEFPEINAATFWDEVKKAVSGEKKTISGEVSALGDKAKAIREGARRVEFSRLKKAKEAAARKLIRDSEADIKMLNERAAAKRIKYEDMGRAFDQESDVDMLAQEIYGKLIKSSASSPEWLDSPLSGVFKRKAIPISDARAAPMLNNDIVEVMDSFFRQSAGDISLAQRFGRPDMKDQFAELEEEYLTKLNDASLTAKQRRKLDQHYRRDVKDLEALRDILRGTYNTSDPDSVFTVASVLLRDLTYMASMGGVLASSLVDVANHVMRSGFSRVFGNASAVAGLDETLSKLRLEDLKASGQCTEAILANRLQAIGDITDPNRRMNMATRASGRATQIFSKTILINEFNDITKGLDNTITQQTIINSLLKGDKITAEESSELARLGISKSSRPIIVEQFKKHGVTSDSGLHISAVSKWDATSPDYRAAIREFNAATRLQADQTVITPGISEKPLVARTAAGSIPFQFTSYMFSAHQKMLLAGLQKQDMNTMMGLLTLTIMGGMIAALKQKESELSYELQGRPYKGVRLKDWTTEKFIFEAVSRANMAPLLFDLNNRYEKLGGYGLSSAMGVPSASNYSSRTVAGVLGGAGVGYLEGAGKTAFLPFKKDATSNDVHTGRKLLPEQNNDVFFGVRFLFDAIEGKVNDN